MNFLQLVQSLKRETVDSGTITSVVGATGENARCVNWVIQAYNDIQSSRPDWKWLHKYFTVNATVGDGEYAFGDCTDTVTAAVIDRFSRWYPKEFKCYKSSDGVGTEYPLIWMEWENFRVLYRYGTQNNSQPVHVSMDNTRKFVLGPIPDGTYVVSGGYERGLQILTADADEPEMPQFHDLIWLEAMSRYGGSRIAPEAMVRAVAESAGLRFRLERQQLPAMTYGRPLA